MKEQEQVQKDASKGVSRRNFLKTLGVTGAALSMPVTLLAATGNNMDPGGFETIKANEQVKFRKEIPKIFYKRIPKTEGYIGTTQVTPDAVGFPDAREHGFSQFFIHGANKDYTGEWGQLLKEAQEEKKKLVATFDEQQLEDMMWGDAITQASDNWHINLEWGKWDPIAINPNKLELPPDVMSLKLKKVAKWFGVDQVGICEIDESLRPFFFKIGRTQGSLRGGQREGVTVDPGREVPWPYPYKYAIVLAKAEGTYGVKTLTGPLNNATVATECGEDDIFPRQLESVIRQLGYDARAQSMNGTEDFNMVAMAVAAGLGELGRNGQIVGPWGAHIRLSVVTTNVPLVADDYMDFGLQEFCKTCKKCAENCPAEALSLEDEPSLIGGVMRYAFDNMKCTKQRTITGCASCAGVCPFTKPDNFIHSVGRVVGRNPLGAKVLKEMDDLFYGVNPTPRDLDGLAPWRI
ncbi:MAG: hypothetical protein APF84_16100 [Gracilibacter sp. BRH_c7a]|nr:MAG: hypothetical protein APF84_16100 [Gracilibacter sp. BRH_c7a]